MQERTQKQNEAVSFYYNLKRLNDNMEKYVESLNMAINAKNKIKQFESTSSDAASKWAGIEKTYQNLAQKSLEEATVAYELIIDI